MLFEITALEIGSKATLTASSVAAYDPRSYAKPPHIDAENVVPASCFNAFLN